MIESFCEALVSTGPTETLFKIQLGSCGAAYLLDGRRASTSVVFMDRSIPADFRHFSMRRSRKREFRIGWRRNDQLLSLYLSHRGHNWSDKDSRQRNSYSYAITSKSKFKIPHQYESTPYCGRGQTEPSPVLGKFRIAVQSTAIAITWIRSSTSFFRSAHAQRAHEARGVRGLA
jgi:hypothetical protein